MDASKLETSYLKDPEATEQFGQQLANRLAPGSVIYLRGDLGAGKTSLVGAILRGWGYGGLVKSPTYTLVEPHNIGRFIAYHFDLYRLNDPEELEFIGGRDYFDGNSVCLVEWPERAEGWLPVPTMEIELKCEGEGRRISLYEAGETE